jgi:hypothetical protein
VNLTKYDDEGHLDTLDLGSGNKATRASPSTVVLVLLQQVCACKQETMWIGRGGIFRSPYFGNQPCCRVLRLSLDSYQNFLKISSS